MNYVFLSAGIPAPEDPYADKCDPFLVHTAIRAFLSLALGRRHIVWGGHPSITPMVVVACQSLGIEYTEAVTLYQSRYFSSVFPSANDHFANVVLVNASKDEAASLKEMRETMFSDFEFSAGVFIGGKQGIIEEYRLFREYHPQATALVVKRPGGAAAKILNVSTTASVDDASYNPIDFTSTFIHELDISTEEPRDSYAHLSPPQSFDY
ncbi:hypothetical protein HP062_16580 [Pseudomonas sp. B14-6]|uniref:SLOG domain-containing protein n=1 Tax=Pseudomonas sp. B14-6 TaxID=2738843 RepID=UPI00155E1E5F|nr:hypothetical protein [Pseudomonas sp. B14-6]QKG67063.1 hypothetical protein HP062_16580 [Pseudomonas sp. B14-6]